MDNDTRIEQARRALSPYFDALGVDDSADFDSCAVVDLVTDLRHLCALEGINFEDMIRISAYHFEAEKEEE